MSSEITEAKQEIFDYIDNLTLSDAMYDIILNLLNNTSDKLFTKIMEEIKDGNLNYEDFTGVFGDSLDFAGYFESQQKAIAQNKSINDAMEKIELNNLVNTVIKGQVFSIKNSIVLTEKENILVDVLKNINQHTPAEQLYIATILEKILSNSESKDEFMNALLVSVDDFVVPYDYNSIKLNGFDLKYMQDNGMSEEEMKKLKAFSIALEEENLNELEGE